MTITINGNGTVTGVSVGGLPDGIVDTDMIAANAVTAAKANTAAFGKILQVVTATDDQKTVSSSSFTDIYDSDLSITLASTSNKVFALGVTSYAHMSRSSGGDVQADYKLVRSTSGDANDNLQTGRMRLQSGTDLNCSMVVSALDSTFSNLANTYNVQLRYHSGDEAANAYNNRLYLFEVAA
tara:strand:- start:212 stop:757 length:546 start_codon:yes stop_codon:yes gene_type:complete